MNKYKERDSFFNNHIKREKNMAVVERFIRVHKKIQLISNNVQT